MLLKSTLIFRMTQLAMRCYRGMGITVSSHHFENIPPCGGAIIVANHRSMIDGPLLYSSMNRMAYSLIKEEYFQNRFMNWYLRGGGGIPVTNDRCDFASLRLAYRHLAEGELLLIFPEGQIHYGDGVPCFHAGFVKLAMACQVPVIPITIFGTDSALPEANWRWTPRSAHVHITAGKPIQPIDLLSSNEHPRDAAERVRELILKTWSQLDLTNRYQPRATGQTVTSYAAMTEVNRDLPIPD
jgi:1-acyl-sn-glycerol-3-phosphate acyltransferase